MGPRMVPWGTPVMTFSLSEITSLYIYTVDIYLLNSSLSS